MEIKWLDSLTTVPASDWDALFVDADPFSRYAFLVALEQGGSVNSAGQHPSTGWLSQHLTVWQQGQLIAAMPGYLKTHSYGEYLFDWQIAQAYQHCQLPFYPKWVAAIPFTPVEGPRLGLLHSDLLPLVLPKFIQAVQQRLTIGQLCSAQWLYLPLALQQAFTEAGMLARQDIQFLWQNHQYTDFSEFLAGLTSRKRKQIRQERLAVKHYTFQTLTGDQLTPRYWQGIIQCYQATYRKRSGHAGYITPASFMRLANSMAQHIVVFAAFAQPHDEEMVAAALCFQSKDTLYGRYWGSIVAQPQLHFELCYYQGIDYCITHQLRYFDAGAQGEHKLKRGFSPVKRYGSYLFAETPLLPAIGRYFQQETQHLADYQQQAFAALPFKQSDTPEGVG